jgi:hypothetical protein
MLPPTLRTKASRSPTIQGHIVSKGAEEGRGMGEEREKEGRGTGKGGEGEKGGKRFSILREGPCIPQKAKLYAPT